MPLICCRVCTDAAYCGAVLMPLNLVVSVLICGAVLMPLNLVVSVLMPLMVSVLMPYFFWLRFHTMSSCDLSWKYVTALHTPIINMYLFDMTNGIPHVASSIQFTSEKTRDPDQLEVGRMTRGSNGSLDP